MCTLKTQFYKGIKIKVKLFMYKGHFYHYHSCNNFFYSLLSCVFFQSQDHLEKKKKEKLNSFDITNRIYCVFVCTFCHKVLYFGVCDFFSLVLRSLFLHFLSFSILFFLIDSKSPRLPLFSTAYKIK